MSTVYSLLFTVTFSPLNIFWSKSEDRLNTSALGFTVSSSLYLAFISAYNSFVKMSFALSETFPALSVIAKSC